MKRRQMELFGAWGKNGNAGQNHLTGATVGVRNPAVHAIPAERTEARESGYHRPLREPVVSGGPDDAATHRSRSPVGPQTGQDRIRDPSVARRRLVGCGKHPTGLQVSTNTNPPPTRPFDFQAAIRDDPRAIPQPDVPVPDWLRLPGVDP
jgi:hypothetical protein